MRTKKLKENIFQRKQLIKVQLDDLNLKSKEKLKGEKHQGLEGDSRAKMVTKTGKYHKLERKLKKMMRLIEKKDQIQKNKNILEELKVQIEDDRDKKSAGPID